MRLTFCLLVVKCFGEVVLRPLASCACTGQLPSLPPPIVTPRRGNLSAPHQLRRRQQQVRAISMATVLGCSHDTAVDDPVINAICLVATVRQSVSGKGSVVHESTFFI